MFRNFLNRLICITLAAAVFMGISSVAYALEKPKVESVKIEGDTERTIYIGDVITLKAVAVPTGFDSVFMVWSTDKEDIVKVNGDDGTTEFEPPESTAEITALAEGIAYVTVHADMYMHPYPDEVTPNSTVKIIVKKPESSLFNVSGYDLAGKEKNKLNVSVTDFSVKEGEGNLLLEDYTSSEIQVSDDIISNSKENEHFVILDMKIDNEDNPYPEIEQMKIKIEDVGKLVGKDYRLIYLNSETSSAEDVSESIIESSETKVSFTAEKLGKYILYYNPAVYSVEFFVDDPIFDEDGNATNQYKVIENLKIDDVIEFPQIPEKEGYVFTGWKVLNGNEADFTQPQPLTVGLDSKFYASWSLENEYEPININITADSDITKGKEDGHKITLKTNYGAFAEDISSEPKSDWNIVGSDDLLIESVTKLDDKTLELTLSGNSRDVYSNSDIYIEFDSDLLGQETDEESISKIQMDKDGIKKQMYRSDNAITLSKQERSAGGGGGGGLARTHYTLTFDSKGGSAVRNQTVAQNSKAAEPNPPKKEGYKFAGWFTDEECTNKYNFDSKVVKNVVLFAKWEENTNSGENEDKTEKNQIKLSVGKKEALVFGETKISDVAPVIREDRAFLPSRFVAESLGASVIWEEDARKVTIIKDDVTIEIIIDAETALVNGEEVLLDVPAFIENDRTYTPIRFISEKLGAKVDWNPENQDVVITK